MIKREYQSRLETTAKAIHCLQGDALVGIGASINIINVFKISKEIGSQCKGFSGQEIDDSF